MGNRMGGNVSRWQFRRKKTVNQDVYRNWSCKIIHVDMDAFFAAIEQRDNPKLKGVPVVIGGDPKSRGVVSTASYEARRFGIRSAMPCFQAYKLCPQAVFLKPDISKYREVSRSLMKIFMQHTDLIEPVSLDEAYLDVTRHKLGISDPQTAAKMIKDSIHAKTLLTASAGVSVNMFLAKIASDYRKPDGLTVIHPENAETFLAELPIRVISGVGSVAEDKLKKLSIETCGQLAAASEIRMRELFGVRGRQLIDKARGIDGRQVTPGAERKQISTETTFREDILDLDRLKNSVRDLCGKIYGTMKVRQVTGRTLVLKVKYSDFELVTRSATPGTPFDDADSWEKTALDLLVNRTEAGRRPVRLLGVGFSNLVHGSEEHRTAPSQADLFE